MAIGTIGLWWTPVIPMQHLYCPFAAFSPCKFLNIFSYFQLYKMIQAYFIYFPLQPWSHPISQGVLVPCTEVSFYQSIRNQDLGTRCIHHTSKTIALNLFLIFFARCHNSFRQVDFFYIFHYYKLWASPGSAEKESAGKVVDLVRSLG